MIFGLLIKIVMFLNMDKINEYVLIQDTLESLK
jgi:hypothetical protein